MIKMIAANILAVLNRKRRRVKVTIKMIAANILHRNRMKIRAIKKGIIRTVNNRMKITRKKKVMRKKGLFKIHLSTSCNRSKFAKHKIFYRRKINRKISFKKRRVRVGNQFCLRSQ